MTSMFHNRFQMDYTHLPPSTGRSIPVIKVPSDPARYKLALAISSGLHDRPNGTVATNPALLASLSSLPRNLELLEFRD